MQLYQNATTGSKTQDTDTQPHAFFTVRVLAQGLQQFSFGLTDDVVAGDLAHFFRGLHGLQVEVVSQERIPAGLSARAFAQLTAITRQILQAAAVSRQPGLAFLTAYLDRFGTKMPTKELQAIRSAVDEQSRGQNVVSLPAFRARVGGAL